MAFLSVVLGHRPNRLANFAIGLSYGLKYLIYTVDHHLVRGNAGGGLLMDLTIVVVTFSIVWSAWKWKDQ